MATTKTRKTKKKTTKAERRAIALRNLKKARAAVKKKAGKKPAAKKTRKAPKRAAKKSAKRTTTRKTAKKTAKRAATKVGKVKRGPGYAALNTLTVTSAQATALGKLMRSHRCRATKGGKTVCMTKGKKVLAVITHGR